ncbi:thioredoxin domain-containing protein 8 isoform X3 [Phascolarctos cinereus]|uniref:Thioredoxin domain-containing protein 8 isoform X4 n=1 Tax=Phascolarctos cinereus TaxID=38626 RepID=A0A6P5LNF9_PHACI|nr:thioredoxin domain-containing protein 8 isoform X4 [Phascolarctos cinereus]
MQSIKNMREFENFLKNAGSKLVVVDFSAKWCGPCKRIGPVVHEVACSCQVKAMPTFQMYKESRKIFEFSGADAKKLEEKIQELI